MAFMDRSHAGGQLLVDNPNLQDPHQVASDNKVASHRRKIGQRGGDAHSLWPAIIYLFLLSITLSVCAVWLIGA